MEVSGLKRDSSQVATGQWVDDIPNMGELRLLVRGLSCPQARTLRDRKERKVDRSNRDRDNTILPATRDRILSEVLHEVVLLDWEGITDNGEPVPYSKELAEKWLTDPDYTSFQDAVTWAALVVDRGSRDAQEVLEKNSNPPSAGNSSGESGAAS